MNWKYLFILVFLVAVGVTSLVLMDEGSRKTELSIISEGEWKGYYKLTLNGETVHENIEGGGSLNFTIKRQVGDKLVVYVNDTYGNKKDLKIKLLENGEIIAQNSSNDHLAGVWLYN